MTFKQKLVLAVIVGCLAVGAGFAIGKFMQGEKADVEAPSASAPTSVPATPEPPSTVEAIRDETSVVEASVAEASEAPTDAPGLDAPKADPTPAKSADKAPSPTPSSAPRERSAASGDVVSYLDKKVDGTPALAIVIDDCGYNMALARKLRDRDLPLTWAIIPNLKHSQDTAKMLDDAGTPYLIHMPMEAFGDAEDPKRLDDPGYYILGVGMSDDLVRKKMTNIIKSLPNAYGINNHRGSVATADYPLMRSVMSVLRENEMFFLDSSTVRDTIAHKVAREYGLVSARNNYFLDNISKREKVREYLNSAIEIAKKQGSAIAIGHLRPETIALFETLDISYFTNRGVRLVTLPELMRLREESRKESGNDGSGSKGKK